MTYSAFMYFLRFLVLCGLFLSSSVWASFSIPQSWRYNNNYFGISSGYIYTGKVPACEAAASSIRSMYPNLSVSILAYDSPVNTCTTKVGSSNYQIDLFSQGACPTNSTLSGSSCSCNSGYKENSTQTSCELVPVCTASQIYNSATNTCDAKSCPVSSTTGNYTVGRGIAGTPDAASFDAISSTKPYPPSECRDACVYTRESMGEAFLTEPVKILFTNYDTWMVWNYKPTKFNYTGGSCVMPPPCAAGTYAGINGVCVGDPDYCPAPNYKDAAGICQPPLPVCVPPQVLNQNKVCETPMCPVGQVRTTASSSCTPIVCTPPLVKEGNLCVLPKCPSGETYEFKDGSGQCVKNDPQCTAPQTLVNGICKTPTCSAGMILSLSGSCIPDPTINPNTKGSTGQTGTGTGFTGTGTGSTGTPTTATTPGGSATPITNPDGTQTAGTTNTASTSTGGTSTNTGKTGLCETPPCGNCDPATATCGDTFGGSCKGAFQCNGDAIQCAVALATNKAECAVKALFIDTETDTAYIEGKASFDAGTKAFGTAGGLSATNGGAIAINSTNPYASSCPADVQLFEYKGSSYAMPLSKYCNIFQIMGNIMLLAASLIALKIIMKVD